MDLILYYKIYEDRVDKEIILEYIKYSKPRYFYYLVKNYVWEVRPKIRS